MATSNTKGAAGAGEDVETQEPLALLVGIQNGAATVGTVLCFLKKLNIELPCDPAILLLGIYPRALKAGRMVNCVYQMHWAMGPTHLAKHESGGVREGVSGPEPHWSPQPSAADRLLRAVGLSQSVEGLTRTQMSNAGEPLQPSEPGMSPFQPSDSGWGFGPPGSPACQDRSSWTSQPP